MSLVPPEKGGKTPGAPAPVPDIAGHRRGNAAEGLPAPPRPWRPAPMSLTGDL